MGRGKDISSLNGNLTYFDPETGMNYAWQYSGKYHKSHDFTPSNKEIINNNNCSILHDADYAINQIMACPAYFYVAGIVDQNIAYRDVICCPL